MPQEVEDINDVFSYSGIVAFFVLPDMNVHYCHSHHRFEDHS
jgi:hypothetical protein